ncbi:histidine phosphatase family protein [Dongia rigui]|uniref:Histidine phosphatase family protein n=1 Tax=Dongia rigui TaxID=940149 RepID=A0ABU5DW78_9PROT|nr:histidine phosphatase family protein [Dongia rigui]MDY0871562.1 histidine phosphatase family protein [Dongia rigui]
MASDHTETRLWLVRHAPVIGSLGRIYGQDDLEADCSDDKAFAALAGFLPVSPVWVATQLKRTHQTLAAVQRGRGLDPASPLIEQDLVEQHFGDWQGLTYAELDASRDGAYHRFWHAPATERPPNGESFADVVARVEKALLRLTLAHAGNDIVVVAHGGSIRAALAAALDIEPERALGFSVDNLSVTRLDHIEGQSFGAAWRVAFVNRRL